MTRSRRLEPPPESRYLSGTSVDIEFMAATSDSDAIPRADTPIDDSRPSALEGSSYYHSEESNNDYTAGSPTSQIRPSIEPNTGSLSADVQTTEGASHSRTPSLSLTPPPSSSEPNLSPSRSADGDRATVRQERDIYSIEARLGDINISDRDSSLDVSPLVAAIDGVERDPENQTSFLEPGDIRPTPESSRRPFSRRRSSSRTNLVPHEVKDEELPRDRFHEPSVQQALRDARRLMSELSTVLGSNFLSTEPDTMMRRLHGEAQKLASFQCPSTRTVGFVGDSGVGKSSLLNSLLDFRELARTSNSGSACTCVVTEYHYHDTDNFRIDVEMFTEEEIMNQITDLLQSYRHYHINRQEMSQDERNNYGETADIARDTFRAMFRGRMENEQFLTDVAENSVLDTLQSWVRDLRHSEIDRPGVIADLKECSATLLKLTSEDSSSPDPAVWPFIKKIKLFSNAHILRTGLVLVDLPGLRDLNSARRHITERYLLECNEIFAICNIGRAATDVGVKSVFELARQARLSNVGIICTKADDIRAEEARRDFQGQKADIIRQLIDVVARDRSDVEYIEQELLELVGEDSEELTAEEEDIERDLHRRSRRAKKRMEDHEFELKRFLIETRNGTVEAELQTLYGEFNSDGNLRIVCVSNSDYWEHRDMPSADALPFLQLSGILAVRKHCLSLVAQSQLRIATKYVKDDITALLSDIELWVQSGAGNMSAERRQTIREALDNLESQLQTDFLGRNSHINRIARSFKDEFLEHIYRGRRIHEWSVGARNAALEWSMWMPQTYIAFCRNYGDHYTEAVGRHNWNEEAIESMTTALAAPYQNLTTTLQNQNDSTVRFIENTLDWAIDYIDAELHSFADSSNTLIEALTSRQHLLLMDVEMVFDNFNEKLALLRTDALSGIRTSLIGQALERSYRACNLEKDRGSDQRRKAIIGRALEDDRLIENLTNDFRTRFSLLAFDLQNDTKATVEEHLGTFWVTLNMIRSENVALESDQDPEFRGRVERQVGEAKIELKRIQAVMDH